MTAPSKPTTQEVADNIVSQISASLSQRVPLLPKSFIRVLSKTLAGLYSVLYKYCGFIYLQLFVRYASDQPTTINGRTVVPLYEWGNLVGIPRPDEATQAELSVEVTVNTQSGVLPSGSQVINTDTGVVYLTLGGVPLDGPTVEVSIRAAGDQQGGDGAGTIGNVPDGTVLQFSNPLANVGREVTVIGTESTGADAESSDDYRSRVLDRFQKRPQGGAYADYEQWGEEAAGIINVYPYTSDTPGQVDLYSEATPASAGNADGIPTTAQLEAVLESVNFDEEGLATRRPANAWVNSYPIQRTYFTVTVTGIQGVPDLGVVRASITSAVESYFLQAEPYIVGLSVPPRRDRITRTQISAIAESVVTAAGGTFDSATFLRQSDNTLLATYVLGQGEKARAKTVAFI